MESSIDFSNLTIYTGMIQHHSIANFDITVMTGDTAFSPTWDMVHGIKEGKLSEEEFTEKYLAILDKSIVENREKWQKLADKQLVVLCCYCRSGLFCHRLLLAKYLENLGAKYLGELEWK